ncbi:hypothetical protein IAT38_000901 [Cryptococcus sp. DSM 104549]
MSAAGPSSKPTKPRRKAGGPGKKGKVFVEDKADLLSLMSSITTTQDALSSSRVAKARQVSDIAEEARKTKKSEGSLKKRAEKERALEEAKAKLVEKQREKRRKKNAAAKGEDAEDVKPAKKRVGFA